MITRRNSENHKRIITHGHSEQLTAGDPDARCPAISYTYTYFHLRLHNASPQCGWNTHNTCIYTGHIQLSTIVTPRALPLLLLRSLCENSRAVNCARARARGKLRISSVCTRARRSQCTHIHVHTIGAIVALFAGAQLSRAGTLGNSARARALASFN